ncbi:MAG: Type 1 glutamine amidotransferase-like domain-containing protein [Bacteroidota bacterium]
MRLYLSSYRLGNHIDQLLNLVGSGRRMAIIQNALDFIPAEDRKRYSETIYDIHGVFEALGFKTQPLDLRNYFGKKGEIASTLKEFDLIWAVGGNAFLLNRAMYQSSFDKALIHLLEQDEIAYGGWSAGICVMGPTLKGIDLCDKPHQIVQGYDAEIRWQGLGIIEHVLVPHYRSDHPEAPMMEHVVAYLKEEEIPYQTLQDGDVLLYNGQEAPILLNRDAGKVSSFNLNKS